MAYQPISLTNYSSQLAEVERQRKMAQALQEQANAPIEIQSYKGIQAPIPWSSVLARGLTAIGANIKEGRAAKRAAELEKFKNEQTAQQIQSLLAPVNVAEQPGLRPMPNPSQLASMLASANAPAAVGGMTPTAGAGGMPGASNQALAAALSGQRLNAGANNPMVAGAAPQPAPAAPSAPPLGLAPIQAAAPMPATTRAATAPELQQRAATALTSPFETVRALGLNTLERAQGLEDEQRKIEQALSLKKQERDDDVARAKVIASTIPNLTGDQREYLDHVASGLGTEGIKSALNKLSENQFGEHFETAPPELLKGYPEGTTGQVSTVTGKLVNVYNPSEDRNREAQLLIAQRNSDINANRYGLERERFKRESQDKDVLTPDAIQQAAEIYVTTGQLPALGMGSTAVRQAILNKAGEINKAGGVSGYQQVQKNAQNRADRSSLTALQRAADQTNNFEKTAIKNADLALSLAAKGAGPAGSPIVNKWIQVGRKEVAGDPDVSNFNIALGTFADEYAKVVTGGVGSSRAITDSARKEAYDRLSKYASKGQLAGGINTMKQEMANRRAGLDEQIAEINERINPSAPAARGGTSVRSAADAILAGGR